MNAFGIEARDGLDVDIFDLNVPKAKIDDEIICRTILQFQRCSQFGLEIVIHNMEIFSNFTVMFISFLFIYITSILMFHLELNRHCKITSSSTTAITY